MRCCFRTQRPGVRNGKFCNFIKTQIDACKLRLRYDVPAACKNETFHNLSVFSHFGDIRERESGRESAKPAVRSGLFSRSSHVEGSNG